jgi:hypothetical protein
MLTADHAIEALTNFTAVAAVVYVYNEDHMLDWTKKMTPDCVPVETIFSIAVDILERNEIPCILDTVVIEQFY